MNDKAKSVLLGIAMVGCIVVVAALGCTQTQLKTAEIDFCASRAAYKAFAATQGGKLDPAPGSPRAKLEADEDKLCAVVGK